MAYYGIEFYNDTDDDKENEIAIVHLKWLTPCKKEVLWPPYKTTSRLNKTLILGEEPNRNSWQLYCIKRIFFQCDDLQKAHVKLKKCENTSDVQSMFEAECTRHRKRNRKYFSDSEEDNEFENTSILLRSSKSIKQLDKVSMSGPKQQQIKSRLKSSNVFINENERTEQSCVEKARSDVSTYNTHITNTLQSFHRPSSTTIISSRSDLDESTCSYCGKQSSSILLKILKEVIKTREEWKEIRELIVNAMTSNTITSLPSDFPVKFPLKTHEDVETLENYLDSQDNQNFVLLYLSTLGGTTISSRTNKILRKLITNELATDYNFAAQRHNKKPFKILILKTVIIRAIQIQVSSANDNDVENAIKIWLKHAQQRLTEENKRKHL